MGYRMLMYVSLSAPIQLGDMVQVHGRSYIVVQTSEATLNEERVKMLTLALPEQVRGARKVSASFEAELTEEGRAIYLSCFGGEDRTARIRAEVEAMDWPEYIDG